MRSVLLHNGSRLVGSTQAEADSPGRAALDPAGLEWSLRDFKSDAATMSHLRLLLFEAGEAVLDTMDDDAVIQETLRSVEHGRIHWVEDEVPARFWQTTPDDESETPGPAAPAEKKEEHRLHFEFMAETGDPIEDPAGFTLIHPDGHTEDGKLSKGKLERSGVEPGTYKMKFKYLESAAWSKSSAHPEENVDLKVTAKGFGDGEAVKIKIFERHGIKPLAEKDAKLKGGAATASWKYRQEDWDPPRGEFIFEAWIGDKVAESGVLTIEAHPVEDLKGVQERLKALGYDTGPVDGVMGPKTKEAVKAFQKDYPPLAVDGIPGPNTQRALSEV